MTTIILLNGASSSGKSSLAKAIQRKAAQPFVHVAMDAFLEMLPPGTFGHPDYYRFEETQQDGHRVTIVQSGPVLLRLLAGMRAAAAAMAAEGNNVILDDVLFDDPAQTLADYESRFAPYRFIRVGVHAPLEVLERRERDRGDRVIGLSRHQFSHVHRGMRYDMDVDTAAASPEECAAQIVAAFGL